MTLEKRKTMNRNEHRSINDDNTIRRREFLKIGGAAGAALILGNPAVWAEETKKEKATQKIKTNIDEILKIPRTDHSLPGLFPGKVVEVCNPGAMKDDKVVPSVISSMYSKGIECLTGKNPKESFSLFFKKDDIIGLKVNPVGAGLISTKLEVVDAVIEWLLSNGIRRENIIIWDRFDFMLTEAGFTAKRYPGIGIQGLQTMETGEKKDFTKVLTSDGRHISADNFDMNVYYWADVDGPKDEGYLNQHVFNGKYSYFGKLVTQKLTKIINIPVFKNTGNGVSMATKNLGYGAICNTNRLHNPLFFNVNTEVLAFPALRDKVVLNIVDGIRGQYDGGPMAVAKYAYALNTLFFATDPIAVDMICHTMMVEKRKSMKVKVNEHPVFTDYLRYAERIRLGIADIDKITMLKAPL